MTNGDILKRRFISLIVDPYCQFGLGDIRNSNFEMTEELFLIQAKESIERNIKPGGWRELYWWELRDNADMPEYVISYRWKTHGINPLDYGEMVKRVVQSSYPVFKIAKHLTTGCVVGEGKYERTLSYLYDQLFPATKKQYDNYIKQFEAIGV